MKNLSDILKEHDFFKTLKVDYIDLVAGCGKNVVFQADQPIFHEGEPANEFYIIRYGQVAIETHDPRRGRLNIYTLNENEVLGWSWLIVPYRWHFDARAVKLTRAIALDATCLRTKCDQDPSLGYEFMQRFASIIVDRLTATRLQALNVYG
jgi:CRP/FNR family cyclic AMP-dependent transcriptional regulator